MRWLASARHTNRARDPLHPLEIWEKVNMRRLCVNMMEEEDGVASFS
jgi:hypothetical protein